jgi:DNA-binding protein Fis
MLHITKITATIKIIALIDSSRKSKTELSEILGISRPTLDKRIKYKDWKKGEMELIKAL